MKKIIIIGAGGHSRVLIASLKSLQRDIIGILDPDVSLFGQSLSGIPIIGNDDKILGYSPDSIELVNGIGSVSFPERRKNVYIKFKKDGYSFASVLHPAAIVVEDVQLGEGVQIMAGAVIQTGCVIGDNSIINTGAVVDHDCIISEHVHVAPGAVISGGIKIGAVTHVGTNATIIQNIEIGRNSIIGAGAVVIRDVTAGEKVIGNPAKTIM